MTRRVAPASLAALALLGVLAAAGTLPAAGTAPAAPPPPLAAAVRAEIDRAMRGLAIGETPPPYFIAVTIVEGRHLRISGRNGSLLQSAAWSERRGFLDLRVGSFELDQTNFVAGDIFDRSTVRRTFVVGLEDDEPAVRRRLWLEMDEAYKQAVETLKRKKAFLATQAAKESLADFSREEPARYLEPPAGDLPEHAVWEERVRALSGLFNRHPEIERSGVAFDASQEYGLLVTSEGTLVARPESSATFTAEGESRTAQGERIRQLLQVPVRSARDLPAAEELSRRVEELAAVLLAARDAPAGEADRAPVLFSGQAAAEVFGQLLADHLGASRAPLAGGDERQRSFVTAMGAAQNPLLPALGREVLPPAFSVVDDPTLEDYQGQALAGSFPFDHEGVRARPVRIVEQGRLVEFLGSRTPTLKAKASNGHAHLSPFGQPRGAMSNLIVAAEGGVPPERMVDALLDLCRRKGSPHGYLVTAITPATRVERDDGGFSGFFMEMMGGGARGGASLAMPLVVYRVDAESGRRTPVRGLVFSGEVSEILEGIVAHADRSSVHPYRVSEGFMGMRVPLGPGSIVCPDILVEKVRFRKDDRQSEAPPFLANPLRPAAGGAP